MSHSSSALAERPWCVALVGNPNCGKTALFNLLTGARQKVANYAGVTVERKVGSATLRDGRTISVVDLPGAYSLSPATPDEQITLEVIEGRRAGEDAPDAIVAVVDATNLRMNLRLVLELGRLGRPMIVALNMADVARSQGLVIDAAALASELGCPVVETVAIRRHGHDALLAQIAAQIGSAPPPTAIDNPVARDATELQREVRRILAIAAPLAPRMQRFRHTIDAVVLHPVAGLLLLATLLFLMFQAVFSWATLPMDAIKAGMAALGEFVTGAMADGPLRSLLVDGVIAGAGGVLVFLPQILILFFFILLLEDSGYLPRAAFLLDNLMGKVGLSGRAFIPLLSSFACAVPGVMATRTIANPRDRLATIMIAPLMTCSARLPVYALLIGAFVPERDVGPFNLRGLTLFGLYVAGVVSACVVAWGIKRFWTRKSYQPLMLELPPYRRPSLRSLALGLWERTTIFMRRVGTIIFSLMVVLWFLSTWPAPPDGATGPAIQYSLAGQLGQLLQHLFAPIGFNWQISIALVPGLAAREVAVGALGTVYALSAAGDALADSLTPVIAQGWSLATAYSLLAWYVFAPQCLSTLAVVKRETNSWRYPLLMLAYLFVLAYAAAFVTYRVTLWFGG
ncbi:MAG: ferrous iron transporter B [Piscinibacter sp.]|uniref:ferrous iron transporter B n=1 Tax=Piscinibacter sp. TaxID=1903157 RepID=UPI001B5BEA7D|nr:ferrous iron transporter B [Piscinibacter sp.]MBP5991170.1 ferrous iron transporter B [Piscinibacter sp.]MBP6028382.1 ferrous iron transporter B [Piscinibacter sp.]